MGAERGSEAQGGGCIVGREAEAGKGKRTRHMGSQPRVKQPQPGG